MKKSYTYRITNVQDHKYYYGVRTAENPYEDLGHKYFSSSSDLDFIEEQKINPSRFKYKVLKIFDSYEEASSGESRFSEANLHKKFNVQMHEQFYNKLNASKTFSSFCAPGYMTVFDTKYRKHTRIKIKDLDYDRYILNCGFNSGNQITIKDGEECLLINKDDFDPNVHEHYRANTTVIKKDGNWVMIPLDEFKPDVHETPRTGQIAAMKIGEHEYKSIDVNVYLANKELYTIPTKGNVQLRKGSEIINVPVQEKQKYIDKGYKHMNSGRSNCLDLVTGKRYKEDSEVLKKTPWLCSGKNNIKIFEYKGKVFNRKNFKKYLSKYENISLYRFLEVGEYKAMSVDESIKKYKKEDFYNENKHKRLI